MTIKTIATTPYILSNINRFVWVASLVFFVGNCTFIALTTFSVIERQSLLKSTRVLASEISTQELSYLQKEKEFSMDAISDYGFSAPEKVAFAQKASWFAFYNR
jgi:hypothetical protein